MVGYLQTTRSYIDGPSEKCHCEMATKRVPRTYTVALTDHMGRDHRPHDSLAPGLWPLGLRDAPGIE